MKAIAKTLIFSTLIVLLAIPSAWAKKEKLPKMPKFPKKSGAWLNAVSSYKPSYKNRVTLVYFWDYTSVNCLREIPILKDWQELYKPYGFQMIWVHAPEFDFAKDANNVSLALNRFKITDPVFLDNDYKVWDAVKNRSWPAKYVVNGKRQIVESHIGEGRYIEMEKKIREALMDLDERMVLPMPAILTEIDRFNIEECGWMTGETYVGHKRSGWWGGQIANKRYMKPGETFMFKDRGERVEKGFFVEGLWINQDDEFEHARETEQLTDYLGLAYVAHEVYVVANQTALRKDSRLYVTRDDAPVPPYFRGIDLKEDELGQTYFEIDQPRLYYLISRENDLTHELRLWSSARGDAINSFSFANVCLSEFEHL